MRFAVPWSLEPFTIIKVLDHKQMATRISTCVRVGEALAISDPQHSLVKLTDWISRKDRLFLPVIWQGASLLIMWEELEPDVTLRRLLLGETISTSEILKTNDHDAIVALAAYQGSSQGKLNSRAEFFYDKLVKMRR